MMAEAYLRVEGAHFGASVYDTQDLGAIQGGSMAMLDAPHEIAERYGLSKDGIGASEGVFRVAPADAPRLVQEARAFLSSKEPFRHLRFMVEWGATEDEAKAKCRLAEMRSLCVVLPEPGPKGVCEVDRIRPAVEIDKDEQKVSAAVKDRRDYRRKHRQRFYRDRVGVAEEKLPETYSHSFHDIVRNPPTGLPDSVRQKMAVMSFDGNAFGEITDTILRKELPPLRRELMEAMIPAMGGLGQAETLLWGGDEMIWVMPAWRAWAALDAFFAATEKMNIKGHRLTHKGGVVICHYKTPIRLAKDLADDLAKGAKGDGTADAVQIEVLESVDIPEGHLDDQRRNLYGADLPEEAFRQDANSWKKLGERLDKVKAGFPRSQMHRLLKQARDTGALKSRDPLAVEPVIAALEQILKDRDTKCEVADLVGARPAEGSPDYRLIRSAELANLWDYRIVPTEPAENAS